MHSFIIQNAQIVLPGEVIAQGSIRVQEGIITGIGRGDETDRDLRVDFGRVAVEGMGEGQRPANKGLSTGDEKALPVIDAQGAIVMPGIIDIHTDALDLEIVPRPGADIPIRVAFRELERKMSGCGFTTVFHSLHLGYDVADGQLRSKYSRREIFETVHQACAGPTLINNKIHLRFEVTGVNKYESCLEFIRGGIVALLSVMDHTPGQGQWAKDDFIAAMIRKGLTGEAAREEFRVMMSRPRIEGERLEALIRLAKAHDIPIASHDDDSPEKVDRMHALGVTICEFPITLETALHATQRGMHVAGGASNILRGGSLSGNLSMLEALRQGAVDTLCSDYYPPAILHSVFKLHREEKMPLSEAVNLATLNPARAAGIHLHTGSITPGKHADLLIVDMVEGLPMITHTIVKGHIVFRSALPPEKDGRNATDATVARTANEIQVAFN